MSTQLITQAETIVEMIDRMPADSILIQHGISWDDYEELLRAVGEARGLRICYDEGTLQVMTLSQKHENCSTLIERIVGLISLNVRTRVLFYGSTTIRRRWTQKGVEPDACFYVQNAEKVGTLVEIDFETDPPPDVVVEIDIHHESISKFPIYAALSVPEFWRYDGANFTIYLLKDGQYIPSDTSLALPLLTSDVLTEFLARSPKQDQYDILLAFEEWLKARQK
jgi:Uma2 family endonuclease